MRKSVIIFILGFTACSAPHIDMEELKEAAQRVMYWHNIVWGRVITRGRI